MHSHHTIQHILQRLLLPTVAILTLGAMPAYGKKTVTIACDWDFAPYEFINTDREPDGYFIEVLRTIFQVLDIPCEFQMNARRQNISNFLNGNVDIIVDYRNRFNRSDLYSTLSSFGYYRFCLAHKRNMPNLTNIDQLKGVGMVVFNNINDSVARAVLGSLADSLEVGYCSPREALGGVSNGDYAYFFWGEEPIKWKLKEYNLPDIVTNSFDLRPSEIHIVGHDKALIEDIDNQYARMQQSGELDELNDKWFHPERYKPSTSPIVLYVIAGALLLSIVVVIVYFIVKSRVKGALHKNEEMETIMHKALTMTNNSVIVNDLRRGQLTNLHGKALPPEGVKGTDFMNYVHPDDRKAMMSRQKSVASKNDKPRPFSMRWNNGTPEAPKWINVAGYSFVEFDDKHHPVDVVITTRNISEELEREKSEKELARRYQKMFESSLVAMSFYDKDGRFVNLNQKMRELCNIFDEETEQFFRDTSLFDLELFQVDYGRNSPETFHTCQHLQMPALGIDKYIEIRVRQSRDDEGNLLYYVVSARDVTIERQMSIDLSKQDKALKKATATNTRYEREMRELMEKCNMHIWHLNFKNNVITFSRSMDEKEFSLTIQEHLDSLYEDQRAAAAEHFRNLREHPGPFNVVHHYRFTPNRLSRPSWYATSGMPLTDSDGNVTEYFGLVRNVSSLMEAQERLKEETARAENSAMLKATFLANMTHEIRTPLNAIVGFSDLLTMVDDPEQHKEFIGIIRNNCDMLMRLINDIFEASTMDIKPLEISPKEVDFAREFAIVAQSLSERIKEPSVQYIIDNPYTSFHTIIDMGRMQQVITNFLTNAVKYTHEGHIRVGYRYEDGGIYMFCEDTGSGIPKDKQARVFDRFVKLNDFVQGTGLGLNICKSIAERSGGRIGVESEGQNCGSFFWIWVPCPQHDATLKPTT